MELDKKIQVKNLCSWSLNFKRIDGIGDISIPANSVMNLTAGEIFAQVQSGNVMFAGNDRKGSHARIYIMDKDMRKELDFEQDEKDFQNVISDERIKEIFALKTLPAFEKAVKNTFVTFAEKSILAESVKKFGLNELNKAEFIKKYTGMQI